MHTGRQGDFLDCVPRGQNELDALLAMALDILGDIERCVHALPLEEQATLTIEAVIEDGVQTLKEYHAVLLERLNASP
jgi:hypothetical protein